MKYKTVLFDLDGTLLDTNALINFSFQYTFKKYGYHFTEAEILAFNGPPLVETFQKINPAKAAEMVQTYIEHNHTHHDEYVTIFPNVIETLEKLNQKGVKMAVVSSKRREGVKKGLQLMNITHYFDSIVSVTDVEQAKPNPESVYKAMEELNAHASTTLIVGDNYHDIVAGQNANIDTAAVAWSLKGETYLREYDPTYMLHDMLDLIQIVGE